MGWTKEQIEANAAWFRAKLQAVKQKNDVAKWAKGEQVEPFVLVDVRGREAFAKGHVKGAACLPVEEMGRLAGRLPAERELVTFCWSHL